MHGNGNEPGEQQLVIADTPLSDLNEFFKAELQVIGYIYIYIYICQLNA